MWVKYEKEVYQFLSVYRVLSYALAAMLTLLPPSLTTPRFSTEEIIIILVILGIYTLLKVFSPLRWREKSRLTFMILVGDFLICILLVIFTNGLSSAFLLYSLTPIMTAALLFEEKAALILAATASVSLSVTHLTLSQLSERITFILQGYNLTLLIIYTLFAFVIASVPSRINLNIRRHIESDAIADERRRIGREIHDGVAQSLSYLNLKAKRVSDAVATQNTEQVLTGIEDIRKVVQDTYDDVRESIDQLSTELRNLPLIPTLRNYALEFRKHNIKVQFNVPKTFPQLSPFAELQLLRIAQEALTNVRRHARATEVAVKLENTSQTVEMVIKDNGLGFALPVPDKPPPGYHGLSIIKERAEELGGTLTISTTQGEGAEVRISLPIEKVRL